MFKNIEGLVVIGGSLYAKTPETVSTAFNELRSLGYQIKFMSPSGKQQILTDSDPIDTTDTREWSASLDICHGKCGSCKGIIDYRGIRNHGRKCERCGSVIYYEIVDGSTIRFSFICKNEPYGVMNDLTMKAKRWDIESGFLYLYPEVMKGLWLNTEKAQQYFDANADKWLEVTEDGKSLIRVQYPYPLNHVGSAISPSDICGGYNNASIVYVWQGKEYAQYSGSLPVPLYLSIIEAWHWAPLKPSTRLHEKIIHACRMVSDCGYYYQDGRTAFLDTHLKSMRTFVEHFTELDINKWDHMIANANRSGPGMIKAIARFCDQNPEIRDEPNIGNVIVGIGKILEGRSLTNNEIVSMERGLSDREERKKLFGA